MSASWITRKARPAHYRPFLASYRNSAGQLVSHGNNRFSSIRHGPNKVGANVSSEYNGVQPVIIPRARTQFIRAARPHKASDQCGRKYRVCITAFWHTRLPLRVKPGKAQNEHMTSGSPPKSGPPIRALVSTEAHDAVTGISRGADAGCIQGLNTQHDPWRASTLTAR